MPEATCAAWRSRPLYWSTIAYTRAWWATDGVLLARIQNHGMTPEILRSIGTEYNVNRSFKREDKQRRAQDTTAIDVCKILRDECLFWPADLPGRAAVCCRIVKRMRLLSSVDDDLVSAATKFMWFLRPKGWTMFDRFAAAGMRVPGQSGGEKLSGPDRMACFYQRLHTTGFSALVVDMQKVLGKSSLSNLPPERILDALFMARGGRGGDQDRRSAHIASNPVAEQLWAT